MITIKQAKLLFLGFTFLKFLYDDFKKSIVDLLRGAPEIDGVILLGPNTNVKDKLMNYIAQLPNTKPRTFSVYGNDKDQIPCDKIKISSNNIYLYAHKTKEKAFDVCQNGSAQFLTLFNAIDMPLYYIPWLDYNRIHFELIGNFYNFTVDQINSGIASLPSGSTFIRVASINHTFPHSINEELLLKPFLFNTDNPYIRYVNYVLTNPNNNLFAINVRGKIEIFTSSINLITQFTDESLFLWQKNQIENFITFFKDNTLLLFRNKEKEFNEFIDKLNEQPILFTKQTANYINLDLVRYKEIMLFNLIIQDSIEKVKSLLSDNDVNVDAVLHDKSTPLHISVSLNNLQITKLLIDLKANIDAAKENQATPLMLSSLNNFTKITELLLESGANVNASDLNSNTALHLAVFKGHPQTVDLLLKFNADINFMNNKFATPIMIASITENIDIVKLLLTLGPDLNTSSWGYERSIKIIQAEILNYKNDPVFYILKNNHNTSDGIKALDNIESYHQYNGAYNISELRECLMEIDQSMCYINLLHPCDIFNNEAYYFN